MGGWRGGCFGVLDGHYGVARGGRAGHVKLAEGALVFVELPLVEEAEGAHAEAEYWRDGGSGGEEGGGAEDGAVAAEGSR